MSIRWLDRRRKRTAPITEGERAGTEPGPITAWLDREAYIPLSSPTRPPEDALYDIAYIAHVSHTSDKDTP